MPLSAELDINHGTANRRYIVRRPLKLPSVLTDLGAELTMHDISASGLLIETALELAEGQTLLIDIPERGSTAATVVWSSGQFFGCVFELSIPAAAVSAALLRSPVAKPTAAFRAAAEENTAFSEVEAENQTFDDDRYSLRTCASFLLGTVATSWALIGLLVFRLTQ